MAFLRTNILYLNCELKDQVVTVPMTTKVAPQAELQQLLLLLPAALGKWTGDLVCIFLVSENASVSLVVTYDMLLSTCAT